ncbi:MAG: glucose-1-phosphate adenylyltransferase subunit GlgD [Ruminococcaceae bacterium]|nr:glucose-1-phosphate adenylyltransferase subunit GlgD [Oscillospiraceae bacterium]
MAASNVLGIIYSNAYDSLLSELTSVRTMGSVPFAGRYRLIDFVLSSMVNSGMVKVGVSTKANYQSLMDHLGSGKPWDLSRKRDGITFLPPFSGEKYENRINALEAMLPYISKSTNEYVLMADCNVVCNLDYNEIIDGHIKSGADITIAYKRGIAPKLSHVMTLEIENENKISSVKVGETPDTASNYSLNIIVMSRALLERLLRSAQVMGAKNFERDIIAANVGALNIRGHKIDTYAKVIDSLQSYYDISMELLSGEYRELFNAENPVFTKVRDDMPAIYGICSDATNSLIADGCIIKGKVENSILFRGVHVAEGAVVRNSIIMQDSFIGANAKVNCAILDKDVVIKPGREISGAETYPLYIGKGITV